MYFSELFLKVFYSLVIVCLIYFTPNESPDAYSHANSELIYDSVFNTIFKPIFYTQ